MSAVAGLLAGLALAAVTIAAAEWYARHQARGERAAGDSRARHHSAVESSPVVASKPGAFLRASREAGPPRSAGSIVTAAAVHHGEPPSPSGTDEPPDTARGRVGTGRPSHTT